MKQIDQLKDEIYSLCFATTIDSQDEERVYEIISNIEAAYPNEDLPDEWNEFKEKLHTVIHGIRDRQSIKELREYTNNITQELSYN